jgi:hypothetical protein
VESPHDGALELVKGTSVKEVTMSSRILRTVAAGAGAFLALAVTAPAALAGETTGNGGTTPIGEYKTPASICAFSGLNDVPDGSDAPGDPFAPGRVQSFGDIIQQVAGSYSGAIVDMREVMQANKPGISCNKNRAPAHG